MIEIIPNWHPIFVHFSVALLSVSVALFVLSKFTSQWRLEDQWLATAYWNLWIGVLITIGTVVAGVIAFNTVEHDTPSHKVMLAHRLWALVTAGIFLVAAIWGVVQYKSQTRPGAAFIILLLVGMVGLGGAAWRGGELVYRHGLGVMSLPNPDDHSHAPGTAAHSHGHDEAAGGHSHDDGGHAHDDLGAESHQSPPAEAAEHSHSETAEETHSHDAAEGNAGGAVGGETAPPAEEEPHSHESGEGHSH